MKIQFTAWVNGIGPDGVTRSYPAACTIDTDLEWMPLEPDITITGAYPNALFEISFVRAYSNDLSRTFVLGRGQPPQIVPLTDAQIYRPNSADMAVMDKDGS
jgi:hypothetical protein